MRNVGQPLLLRMPAPELPAELSRRSGAGSVPPPGTLADAAASGVLRQLFRAVQRDDVQTVQLLASLGADLLGARDSIRGTRHPFGIT